MYGTATDEAVDAMHDEPATDEARARKPSFVERERTEQRQQAEARRQQTLARLRWAKGRGQTVEELAQRMKREPNSVLRDLRELEARGDVHECSGLWYLGPGTEPTEPQPARAREPRPTVDIPAVVLEVLGDRKMFAGELASAVEARLPSIGRAAIAVQIGRMRETGAFDDDGLRLQRSRGGVDPSSGDQTAAVEGRDTGAFTDGQGAGAPANKSPRSAPAPVEQAGAAPASVGAQSPVGGDRPSPPDPGATAGRALSAESRPAEAHLESGPSLTLGASPCGDGTQDTGRLTAPTEIDEDLEARSSPDLEAATGVGVETAGTPSSQPAPLAPRQEGEDHAGRERSAPAEAGATDRDRQGTEAPQPAAPQWAQPGPAEEEGDGAAVGVQGGAERSEVGPPDAPLGVPEAPERAPLRPRLRALVHAEPGLSITEAAVKLGCHPTRVGQLARELELRRVKRGVRRVLYPPMTKRNGVPSDTAASVLDFVRNKPGCSVHEVAAHIEASDAWARRVMRTLGCVCRSTNRVSRWFPPADSEPPIAVPCPDDDAPLSQSEQPRPGAGEDAGGDEPSQSASALVVHSPPSPGIVPETPSMAVPEADGSVDELEIGVLLEALRLAMGLDDEGWTAGELVAEVHQLNEDNRKLSVLVNRHARALDLGKIPRSPPGEGVGFRLGILVERLRGVSRG